MQCSQSQQITVTFLTLNHFGIQEKCIKGQQGETRQLLLKTLQKTSKEFLVGSKATERSKNEYSQRVQFKVISKIILKV